MNRTRWIAASIALMQVACSTGAYAQSTPTPAPNLCVAEGTTFAYFNGVQTTRAQGDYALEKLKLVYGTTDSQGKVLRYELFYNWTNGFEDFVETFAQRLTEQQQINDRFELFAEFNRGGGRWTTALSDILTGLASGITSYADYVNARDVAAITSLLSTPPTLSNYAVQRARLDTIAIQGNKLLIFAHSQGNLFANAAYSYVAPKIGAQSVGVVHVAPASPTVNGPHSLADKDLVINALRLAGTVPPITKTIPGYLLRPAGLNGETDFLGHGLLEIYMNGSLATRGEIDGFVRDKLASLQPPQNASATSGFLTVTLTWNGTGDVDLHTYEPNNVHVFYSAKTGSSGFLDVDNTDANGPEHYYASCDPTKLLTRTYQFSINNFARATGRTATLQIASYNDGPLLTKDVGVGAERGTAGNNSPIPVARATITKDEATGKYSIAVQ